MSTYSVSLKIDGAMYAITVQAEDTQGVLYYLANHPFYSRAEVIHIGAPQDSNEQPESHYDWLN